MEETVRVTLEGLISQFGPTQQQQLQQVILQQVELLFNTTTTTTTSVSTAVSTTTNNNKSSSETEQFQSTGVAVTSTNLNGHKKQPVRVYIDGCFDIMHSGHYNALRQAKKLGDILVAGVHSDEEILRHKGPPIMNEEERTKLVRACKWVDEVAFGVPYSPTVAVLDSLNCDFGVHGDDIPTNAEGTSAYAELINAGRCKIIKRTEGISTTALVGRLLLMTREHHMPSEESSGSIISSTSAANETETVPSQFLPTIQRIYQFSKFADQNYLHSTKRERIPEKIVYIDGAFDLFHLGHIEILEKAKQLGDFLLVGIHDDKTVNKYMGKNYPIMNLHERVLNVLSCKYVDEVILGAPRVITAEMITTMNIKVVVSGFPETRIEDNPYRVPKEQSIYQELSITRELTTEIIVERILTNRQKYQAVYEKKKKKEEAYVQDSAKWRADLREL